MFENCLDIFLSCCCNQIAVLTTEHPPQNCVETDASYVSTIIFFRKTKEKKNH
jgi:hypothetical protein